MKLATFRAPGRGEPLAGEVLDDRVVAFRDGTTVVDVLSGRSPERSDDGWPLSEVELLAPVPEPTAIYAIGLNYAAHASETGGEPPERPIVFVKVRNSVAPPGGPVRCPAVVRRLDYEGELVIAVGAGGRIGGYCVADDVTARDLQGREPQWTRAKGADTFCPLGPWITTVDELPDAIGLRLTSYVNGELRQDATTADLIFGPQQIVDHIAEAIALQPGDLILTGTPSGVGEGMKPPRYLEPGDVVRCEVERLGVIEHQIVDPAAS